MSDPERLARLCSELGSDPAYAVGARPFPRRVGDEDAEAIAAELAQEMDRGTAARARQAALQGHRIVCHAGCSACCDIMVMVYRPEALRIARWLERPDNAAARAAFLAAYERWRAAVGDVPERLSAMFVQGARRAYDRLHEEHWRRGVACAFLREGRCSIYPVRPIACRNAHALDTSERCRPGPAKAAALAFLPLDDFLQSATRLLRATHNASGAPRHGQQALCAAVHRLLTGA